MYEKILTFLCVFLPQNSKLLLDLTFLSNSTARTMNTCNWYFEEMIKFGYVSGIDGEKEIQRIEFCI